jgi:hypothetical protein
MRLALVALATLLVLVASAPAAGSVSPVRLRLVVSTKTPVAETPWRWTVTATRAGKRVQGTVRLNILLGPAVVGCWRRGKPVQCSSPRGSDALSFTGRRTGVIRWPAQAQGVTLVFQAVVQAQGKKQRFRVPVAVQPAASGSPSGTTAPK